MKKQHEHLEPPRSEPARRRLRLSAHRTPRAFTIIELLVVVAVIILLLAILTVAVQRVTRTAAKTSTTSLMNAIAKGLERFKTDIGYYPPVLGVAAPGAGGAGPNGDELRRLFPNSVPDPDDAATYIDQMQSYYSTCTMAEYLVGWDHGLNDGYGSVPANQGGPLLTSETPASGIRHPDDGVWGATVLGAADGSLVARTPVNTGKVFGPYVELTDERLLAAINYGTNGLETYFRGDVLPAGQTWETMPKAIVDYWGMPIRYYRRPYPLGAMGQSYRAIDRTGDGVADRVPTLSDVYLLRPWTIEPGTDSVNTYADGSGSTATTRQLDAAEFALFSAGADKEQDEDIAVDPDELNKDNIIEVGP